MTTHRSEPHSVLARLHADSGSITHTPVPDTMSVMAAQRLETLVANGLSNPDGVPTPEQVASLMVGTHPCVVIVRRSVNATAPASHFHMLAQDAWPALTPEDKRDWLSRAIALCRDGGANFKPEVKMHHTTDPYLASGALEQILQRPGGPTPNAIASLVAGDDRVSDIIHHALVNAAPPREMGLAPSNICDNLDPIARAAWVNRAIDICRAQPATQPVSQEVQMPHNTIALDPPEPDEVANAIVAGKYAAEMELATAKPWATFCPCSATWRRLTCSMPAGPLTRSRPAASSSAR